jgi:hypothetical protein
MIAFFLKGTLFTDQGRFSNSIVFFRLPPLTHFFISYFSNASLMNHNSAADIRPALTAQIGIGGLLATRALQIAEPICMVVYIVQICTFL